LNSIAVLNDHYKRYFHSLFYPQYNVNGSNLTLNESILLSWPFIIVSVITNTVFAIFITVSFVEQLPLDSFPFLDSGNVITLPILYGLFWSLWGVLLFPLRAYIYVYILKLIIGFYQRLTKQYSRDPHLATDLAAAAMSSNVFKVIPGIGDMIQSLAQFLCLLKGLKLRMGINSFAAFCILFTPALLMLLFFAGIIYSAFLLFFL
jgi:hypothetical protein